MLTLNFIWHMHQPDYRDSSGMMRMPWVFMHAIKDYFDMPFTLSKFENIKATFNLTPTLIEQLLLYENFGINKDRFLLLLKKDSLTKDEKDFVIKICKSSPYETMVSPYPRYKELYKKESLNSDELIDLEVVFLLSWCGGYLKESSNLVKKLLKKQKGFSKEEKYTLIDELIKFIPKILPFYKKLQDSKKISISTTPFFHPILPLLIDMNSAKEADKNISLPKNPLSLIDDAKIHIKKAKELYKRVFDKEAEGFWPAEGAVDKKSISIYKSENIKWIATDEDILFKSIKDENRKNLYKLYNFNDVKIVFRDKTISDLIGFTYKFWDEKRAVDDLIGRLKNIYQNCKDGVVSIILDGENAWEYYKNSGKDFLNTLYEKLLTCNFCRCKIMDELIGENSQNLKDLKPGSWIYGNFNTWVGDEEKNRAWELLYQTKRDYYHHLDSLDKIQQEKIQREFLEAECSDWYWWYGRGHYTKFNIEFDKLFRNHLMKIYSLMNLSIPANLKIPISKSKNIKSFINEPKSYISPIIDGKETSFFEWLDSGLIDESRVYTTMQKQSGPIKKLYWGEDEKNIYLRLDGDIKRVIEEMKIDIFIENEKRFFLNGSSYKDRCIQMAADEIIEISINKECIKKREIYLRVEIEKEDRIVQILPGIGELKINLDENFKKSWFV